MVLIFHDGGQPVTVPLEELKIKTAEQVIEEITKCAVGSNTFLARCGLKFPMKQPLASASIVDDDFLRIVSMESPSTSHAETKMTDDEIESLRRQCIHQFKTITRDQRSGMYMDMLSRMVDPVFFQHQLHDFPELNQNPAAVAYIAEPMLLFNIFRDTPNMKKFCHENPILLKVTKRLMDNTMTMMQRMFEHNLGAMPRPFVQPPQAQPQQQGQAPITAEFLQQAINFAMGGGGAVLNPLPQADALQPAAPPAQADPFAEARQRYTAELAQMRECGFIDDDLNLSVLMQVQGNVATAMEILIEDMNP